VPNYGRDLATGMAIGEKLMGNINQGIATRKRTALREEVDKGLVKGEDGSYDYLGKKFQYEPSRYERSALEAEKRATLEEDWGDQERADAYRAITQGYIEKDLDHRTRQILASGNPAQAVDLWNQHNPDRMARWENNQLLFSPRGREDWLPVYSGDPQGAMEFIGSQYSPDVVKEMADTRLKNMERELRMSLGKQNLAQGDLSMENMRQGMGERGMDRQDADFQMKQMEYAVKGMEAEAKRLEEAGEFDQASAMRQQIQQAKMGLTRGSGGGGGGSGARGAANDSIPPRAIYDYLVQQKGVPPTHAVGVLASLEEESGFSPNPGGSNDNGSAYGLFQHRDPKPGEGRKTNLFKHAGTDAPSWTQQIDYALTEPEMQDYLKQDYGGDVGKAADGFTRIFERPKYADKDAATRARLAQNYREYTQAPGAASGGLTRAPQAPAQAAAGTYGPGEYVSKMLGTPAQTAYARGLEEINAAQYSPDPALNAKLRNDKLWDLAEGLGVPAKFRQQANQDANAALSAKMAKDGKPAAPPTEPNAFLEDIRTGLQTEGADKEAAQAKAGLERGVGRTLDSLGWYADNKNSPSVKAQAAKALEEIRGVLPDLSPQGVVTARKAAEGLFRIFPDLK
jgi:hypothetical protein